MVIKLNGNEKVELCAEENNNPIWTISQLTLDDLLNTYILGNIKRSTECLGKMIKADINYFSIAETMLTKRTRLHAKFNISLRKYPKDDELHKDFECIYTFLDVCDFYNAVIDLYYDYSEIFNTTIDNIKIKLIELDIRIPAAFTEKGFINSKVLNQYDLDGQINILSSLLKTQKWEITDNKIIFTELINDKFIEALIKLQGMESFIECEKNLKFNIEHAKILGIDKAKKIAEQSIEEEKTKMEKLKKRIEVNQEMYSLNLRKYIPKFSKEEN